MQWSHWHNHSFDNGKLYITKDLNKLNEWEFVFGYLVADKTTLYHPEHWEWDWLKTTIIPDWIYVLRKQREYTNEWLKPVLD